MCSLNSGGFCLDSGVHLKLLEKTDLLQNITNHMFDMVSMTDLEGVFTYIGPSHRILDGPVKSIFA